MPGEAGTDHARYFTAVRCEAEEAVQVQQHGTGHRTESGAGDLPEEEEAGKSWGLVSGPGFLRPGAVAADYADFFDLNFNT